MPRPNIASLAGIASGIGLAIACGNSGNWSAVDCGRIFDALDSCALQAFAPTETEHVRQRFVEACEANAALPGSGLAGKQLAACANAYEAGGCALRVALPSVSSPEHW